MRRSIPSVKVTDAGGNPVKNFIVTFAVVSGGGSVGGGAVVTTDSSGVATVNSWTLGPSVGVNTLTATGTGLSGSPVTFTANGVAGPAGKMAMVPGGTGQTVHVGTPVSIAPSVLVIDVNNNPVAGVTVVFAVRPWRRVGDRSAAPSRMRRASRRWAAGLSVPSPGRTP